VQQLVDLDGLLAPLDLHLADEHGAAAGQPARGVLADGDAADRRAALQARGDVDGVADRRLRARSGGAEHGDRRLAGVDADAEARPARVLVGQPRGLHLDGQRRAPISLCGRNAVQIHERFRPVDLADLARRLAPLANVRANDFAVRASIDSYELTVFPDGRAIIKGTTDPAVARSLYARYVGM